MGFTFANQKFNERFLFFICQVICPQIVHSFSFGAAEAKSNGIIIAICPYYIDKMKELGRMVVDLKVFNLVIGISVE